MAAKKKVRVVEAPEPVWTFESIVPCSGDFRAVFNEGGEAVFSRVAVWAHVEETVGRMLPNAIVVAMVLGNPAQGDEPGRLIFADEEDNFMGICAPGDEEEEQGWILKCREAHEAAEANKARLGIEDDHDDDDDDVDEND
jgi:hypothetical protein